MRKEFNWLVELEAAINKEPTNAKHIKLTELSAAWPTCACGQLCKKIARLPNGQPIDQELSSGGAYHVKTRSWERALYFFKEIEFRTAALLRT